jgi:hypothetical protein
MYKRHGWYRWGWPPLLMMQNGCGVEFTLANQAISWVKTMHRRAFMHPGHWNMLNRMAAFPAVYCHRGKPGSTFTMAMSSLRPKAPYRSII